MLKVTAHPKCPARHPENRDLYPKRVRRVTAVRETLENHLIRRAPEGVFHRGGRRDKRGAFEGSSVGRNAQGGQKAETEALVKKIMESAGLGLGVPLHVESGWGDNWADAH